MGILRFFSALSSNGMIKNSVIGDFKGQVRADILLFDFNAIIHKASAMMLRKIEITARNLADDQISMEYSH